MYKGCINMLKKRKRKGFTLVELLAVIVILAVVILIAVTAVIPRMNNAKKKALLDEALMYLKAAKESIVFDGDQSPSCINVSNLNDNYIKKSSDSYTGVVKNEYVNGELSQTINLTNGSLYIVGTDNLTSADVKSTMPKGFASSCADYNPVIAEGTDTNTLAYKLIMNEGGSTLDANLNTIDQRTSTVNFNTVEKDASKSGLYKAEDDDGASFYYRGVVNNNWVEFGGFSWRIVRINGDGSIRLIYSGLSSSNHTGNAAVITSSLNSVAIRFQKLEEKNVSVPDVSGLTNTNVSVPFTNGRFGNTYVGYMYNPEKTVMSYQNFTPSNSRRLAYFTTFYLINNNRSDYYFFKDFDVNTDCNAGSQTEEDGTCVIKCRELGVDCVASNWNTLATTEGNYSTTADGIYPATNPTQYIYTSPFKYTCWEFGTPVLKNNSDGTTSVYISCPIVSEIVGTVKDQPTRAKVRFHGLFSASEEISNQNIKDSNMKYELEYWYEHNIYNHKDELNVHNLEEYISDEIFCGDRTSISNNFPITNNGDIYVYGPYTRNVTNKNPSLKCPNKKRDGYSLSLSSNSEVDRKNNGNSTLKYPIGLLTMDEAAYAGGKYNVENKSYYLYSNGVYYLMSPYGFYSPESRSSMWTVNSTGSINGTETTANQRVRPVINLKASVLYDSGSGTETDPYKVKLSS